MNLFHRKTVLFVLCAILLLIQPGCKRWKKAKTTASSRQVIVTIYHTTDLHETSDPMPRIAKLVKDTKAKDPHVLFFDTGDWFNKGDLTALDTRGEAMMEMLSACAYDGVSSGNHDYTFGTERLFELLERYQIPFLAVNCQWPEGMEPSSAQPFKIFRWKDVSVGVIGTASTISNHKKDDLLRIEEIVPAVRAILPSVQSESDVIVLLTHLGGKMDRLLATELPEVDIILGGHDHGVYDELVLMEERDTLILHSGGHGNVLGELVLTWDGESIVDRNVRHIQITQSMAKDPIVESIRVSYLYPIPLPEAEGF